MAIEQIFFELIRISVGTQESLSKNLSSEEWTSLYEMAEKQGLLGICFAGVQKLNSLSLSNPSNLSTPSDPLIPSRLSTILHLPGLSAQLYIKWMSVATKIQQRNQLMNDRCDRLCKLLDADGFSSVILKGQGVAKLYGSLADFRQPGDIDVWMCPQGGFGLSHTERAIKVIRYLKSKARCGHTTYHNTLWKVSKSTEIEAHYTPSWLYSPIENKRLQKWFESVAEAEMKEQFSSLSFNRVYILQHIYRHLFGEGIGLRQVLDYYFVLMQSQGMKDDCLMVLESIGLRKFAGAMMYILESHLGLDAKYLLCPADPKEGMFLLDEIMKAGNFGHYDERLERSGRKGKFRIFWMHVKRNMHFIGHYPKEVLWCPLWKVWHQLWLKQLNVNK